MNDIEEKLQNVKKPDVSSLLHKDQLKMTLLSSERTASVTIWFVAIPCFFLAGVVMKYFFHLHVGFFSVFEGTVAALDRSSGTWFVSPLLLVGLPIISVALNAASLLHLHFSNESNELIVTVKLKPFNIFLLLVSAGIVGIFFLYLVKENLHHLS